MAQGWLDIEPTRTLYFFANMICLRKTTLLPADNHSAALSSCSVSPDTGTDWSD